MTKAQRQLLEWLKANEQNQLSSPADFGVKKSEIRWVEESGFAKWLERDGRGFLYPVLSDAGRLALEGAK